MDKITAMIVLYDAEDNLTDKRLEMIIFLRLWTLLSNCFPMLEEEGGGGGGGGGVGGGGGDGGGL